MRTLSRKVLDDAIEMTLRSERLPDGRRDGLVQRLRVIRDGFCESGDCRACTTHCACEDLVRQAFAGDAPERRVGP